MSSEFPPQDLQKDDDRPLAAPDQIVSDMFDSANQATTSGDASCEQINAQVNALKPEGWRHVARMQFLNALLIRLHRPEPQAMETRIRQVLEKLDEIPVESESPPPLIRNSLEPVTRRHWIARLMMAASILLLVGYFWNWSGTVVTVEAAVAQAVKVSQLPRNREYRVHTIIQKRNKAPQQILGTLYVKGVGKYAYRQPGLLEGNMIWLGSDGKKSWFVPGWGPVMVSQEAGWSNQSLEEQDVATPYLELTTLLKRLQNDYRLEFLARSELNELPGRADLVSFQHIYGTLTSPDESLPSIIEVWVHPETGEVRRMILDWQESSRKPGLRRISFELEQYPELPTNWYQHESHHEPERKVILSKSTPAK